MGVDIICDLDRRNLHLRTETDVCLYATYFCAACSAEMTAICTNLNATQRLLINTDRVFGSCYHISQSGIRGMKG